MLARWTSLFRRVVSVLLGSTLESARPSRVLPRPYNGLRALARTQKTVSEIMYVKYVYHSIPLLQQKKVSDFPNNKRKLRDFRGKARSRASAPLRAFNSEWRAVPDDAETSVVANKLGWFADWVFHKSALLTRAQPPTGVYRRSRTKARGCGAQCCCSHRRLLGLTGPLDAAKRHCCQLLPQKGVGKSAGARPFQRLGGTAALAK